MKAKFRKKHVLRSQCKEEKHGIPWDNNIAYVCKY